MPGKSTEEHHVISNDNTTVTESHPASFSEEISRIACYFQFKQDLTWHLRVAQTLKLEGYLPECKDKLKQIIQLLPDWSLAYYELADVHFREDNKLVALQFYLKSYHGFDATNDVLNQVAAALKISDMHEDRETALGILESVWDKASSIQLTEEELHYAYIKSLVNELKERSEFEKICQYFNKLAADTTPTGESRLTRYCLREASPPLVAVLFPTYNVHKFRSQSVHIIQILEQCLKEARLTGHILIPILQDYLARYLFQTTSNEKTAFELWGEVLQNQNTSYSVLSHRCKANATRYLSSRAFTKALVAKALHQEKAAERHLQELRDILSRGTDATQSMWWSAHCNSLMGSVLLLITNSVTQAHQNFRRDVKLAIDILEDWDKSNDVSGFLMLLEVFMTTGVDDEDANSAMTLFLQYLLYDETEQIIRKPLIECHGCGEEVTWRSFRVCRYCKSDFCDECFLLIKDDKHEFRLCHPLHEFFKPWGPSPAERPKGYVEVDGKEVEFVEWVDGLKKKWEV